MSKILQALELANNLNKKSKKLNPDRDPVAFIAKGNEHLLDFGVIPTGNHAVDNALEGGLPRGTIVMITGQEGTGKTCLAFDCIAHNQKLDPEFMAVYLHLESTAFPLHSAIRAGVDLDRLFILHVQETGEAVFDSLVYCLWDSDKKIPRNVFDIAVVDSVAAAAPAAEIKASEEEGLEKATVGRHAAMMSRVLRRISGTGALGKTCLLLINQLRVDINAYGGPIAPGGKAVLYYPKVIIKISSPKKGYIKEGNKTDPDIVGHTVEGDVVKNNTSIGKPHASFEYKVRFGEGVDFVDGLIDYALSRGVILETSKSRFLYIRDDQEVKIHGRETLGASIRGDNELKEWLEDSIARADARISVEDTALCPATDAATVYEVPGLQDVEPLDDKISHTGQLMIDEFNEEALGILHPTNFE